MAASMSGWRKAMLLLVLPLLAGQPLVGIGNAREASLRTHDDASMLAQVSQAVLADEPYEEEEAARRAGSDGACAAGCGAAGGPEAD